jgi:hypothetical protein
MDEEDSFRALDEFHAQNDPVARMRARMRMLALECIATFSDPTIYDRAGRELAAAEWQAAMPALVKPVPLKQQIREHKRRREGRALLDIVAALAEHQNSAGLTKAVDEAAAWLVEDARQRNVELKPDSVRRRLWRWIEIYRAELNPALFMTKTEY